MNPTRNLLTALVLLMGCASAEVKPTTDSPAPVDPVAQKAAADAEAKPSEESSHQFSRGLRPPRQTPAPRHRSPNPLATTGTQTAAGESNQAQTATPRLGNPPSAHVRHRRTAVPLRWAPHHQGPLLNPQGRRRKARRSGSPPSQPPPAQRHRPASADPRRVTPPPGSRRLRPPRSLFASWP